jgi:hypothetical protein
MLDFDLEDGADLEPEADHEFALGSPEGLKNQEKWAAGAPIVNWDDGLELDESDTEPSLGARERHPTVPHPVYHRHGEYVSNDPQDDQTRWAAGGGANDECEKEDEHGGDINDEPHDEVAEGDKEPSLGATTCINQNHAWRASGSGDFWGSGEGEPSLAFTNIPAMLPRGYDSDREGGDDDREFDPAEDGIGDLDGLAEQTGLGDGGGMLPCLDQSVESASSIMSDDGRSVQSNGRRYGESSAPCSGPQSACGRSSSDYRRARDGRDHSLRFLQQSIQSRPRHFFRRHEQR